jgi:hypothetical protein
MAEQGSSYFRGWVLSEDSIDIIDPFDHQTEGLLTASIEISNKMPDLAKDKAREQGKDYSPSWGSPT